jgi:HlyD family secretion protein
MKRALIILTILVVAGAGAGAYYMTHRSQPISVSTAPVTRGDIVDAVASTGTLQPVISVSVGSQVSGNIAWLGADFNSLVKKGQVIAKLDPTLFESQIAQAKAQVAQASANLENAKAQLAKEQANLAYLQLTYQRQAELREQRLVTQDQLDAAKASADAGAALVELAKSSILQAQASVDQAKAQLRTAQTNLEHSIITSPIDGIVTQRSVDVGQTVQSSMTAPQLFVIAEDLTQMLASASIDESDVGRVTPGADVTFRVDAFPGVEFHGTVAQIRLNPTIVNNVTTYATIINVPNRDLRLKPGMTANIRLQVARRSGGLRVPNTALRFRPSADMFAALNQPVPPEAQIGGRGRRGGGLDAQGGQAGLGGARGGAAGTAATSPSAALPSPAAPAVQEGGQRGPGRGGDGEPAGGGSRGGGRGASGDQRARLMERFKGMSPDEQKQLLARMKDRGADTSELEAMLGGQAAAKTAAAGTGFVFTPRYGPPQSDDEIAKLFRPAPTAQTQGRVWLFVDRQLKPVNLRLGITDGTLTEFLSGDLQEGTEIVTGITGPTTSARAPAAGAGNPVLGPQGGRGGFGRGF